GPVPLLVADARSNTPASRSRAKPQPSPRSSAVGSHARVNSSQGVRATAPANYETRPELFEADAIQPCKPGIRENALLPHRGTLLKATDGSLLKISANSFRSPHLRTNGSQRAVQVHLDGILR